MNFEDQLKNLTQDSRKNEELEKLRLEELRRIAKYKETS